MRIWPWNLSVLKFSLRSVQLPGSCWRATITQRGGKGVSFKCHIHLDVMSYFVSSRVSTRICGCWSMTPKKASDLNSTLLSSLKPEALTVHTHLSCVFKLSAWTVLGCVVERLKTRSSPLMRLMTHLQVVFNWIYTCASIQSKRLMADKLTPAALSYKLPATYDNL